MLAPAQGYPKLSTVRDRARSGVSASSPATGAAEAHHAHEAIIAAHEVAELVAKRVGGRRRQTERGRGSRIRVPTLGSGCTASRCRRLAVVVGVECHHLGQPKHNTSTEPTGRSPRSHRGCRVDGEEGRQLLHEDDASYCLKMIAEVIATRVAMPATA